MTTIKEALHELNEEETEQVQTPVDSFIDRWGDKYNFERRNEVKNTTLMVDISYMHPAKLFANANPLTSENSLFIRLNKNADVKEVATYQLMRALRNNFNGKAVSDYVISKEALDKLISIKQCQDDLYRKKVLEELWRKCGLDTTCFNTAGNAGYGGYTSLWLTFKYTRVIISCKINEKDEIDSTYGSITIDSCWRSHLRKEDFEAFLNELQGILEWTLPELHTKIKTLNNYLENLTPNKLLRDDWTQLEKGVDPNVLSW